MPKGLTPLSVLAAQWLACDERVKQASEDKDTAERTYAHYSAVLKNKAEELLACVNVNRSLRTVLVGNKVVFVLHGDGISVCNVASVEANP